MRLGRSRRGRLGVSLALSLVTTAILAVAGRSLVDSGWPLAQGHPVLVAATGVLFLLAYGFKAYGWRRLFRPEERPGPLALAAAGGGASIMGVALPGRFDELVRVAIVRRYPGCPVCVRGLCLSLLTLGLIDTVALSPLATAAAAFPGNSPAVRAGFAVIGIGGLAAAAVVLGLPRAAARTRLARFRVSRWVAPRATPWRDAARAWALVLTSWLIRVAAIFLLLSTFGIGLSLPLAIMFICAGAASAAIPIGPAGAATQITAGATLLVVSGVEASQAVGFALAAQTLLILSGAAIFLAAVAWHTGLHAWSFRPGRAARLAGI
ncbi:MAG TPA: lysylphosphatidylglycerol synthase domain-containing protein [Gaiellaceae bacterium]|nr:lysylphosphatidylglycerol synthase domain-containing protein [Gaiellaceae bacterium]